MIPKQDIIEAVIKQVKICRVQIAQIYPDKSDEELYRITMAGTRHLGDLLIELKIDLNPADDLRIRNSMCHPDRPWDHRKHLMELINILRGANPPKSRGDSDSFAA